MIKFSKYFLSALFVLLLSNNCSASLRDSTEEEKLLAKMNAIMEQVKDSTTASEASDEDEVPVVEEHTGPTGQETYLKDSIQKHELNKADWKEVTKGLTYSETSEKPKPLKNKPASAYKNNSGSVFQINSNIGQIILIIVVALLLGFILYKLFSGQISNTKVGKQKTYSIEEIEDAIHESDLERYLKEAIQNKEYRIAIRIYYLMAIKALSEREWIKWKKDKTNNQYLFEMSTRPNYSGFRDITRLFEFAWYGEMTVDEKHFQMLDPKFKEFLKQIDTLPA